jgi:hypothetical protein
LALAVPVVSADKMMWAAWDLQARLPGIGGLLAAGELTYAKAKVVHEVFLLLSDEDAASAEALVLPELAGKTYGQVKRLAEQAAITGPVRPRPAHRPGPGGTRPRLCQSPASSTRTRLPSPATPAWTSSVLRPTSTC